MSMGYIKNGEYVQVAGNPPPSGELVTGISTIRKGTVTGTTSVGYNQGTVTFDSPMPDDDYEVAISYPSISTTHHTYILVNVFEKTATGFKYSIRDTAYGDSEASEAQAVTCTFSYTAFKLYTVEGLQELEDKVNGAGIKTLWTGSVTRGGTISVSVAGYDEVYALIGGTWARLVAGHGASATQRKKFTAVYAGRDNAAGRPYEQYYILDILSDGTVATCGWFDVGALNRYNASIAAQNALTLAKSGGSWSEPVWRYLADYENNINVTKIVGVKYNTLA